MKYEQTAILDRIQSFLNILKIHFTIGELNYNTIVHAIVFYSKLLTADVIGGCIGGGVGMNGDIAGAVTDLFH